MSWLMVPAKDRPEPDWQGRPRTGVPGAGEQLVPTRKFGLKITATAATAASEVPNRAA